MNKEKWEEAYRLAMLEVDGRKMPERISTAREAMVGRLREMQNDSDHQEERGRLDHALNALKVMTTESQEWR
jgi:hypothetical protein